MPIGLIIAISVGAGMAIGSALTNFFSKDEKVTIFHKEWGELSNANFSPGKFKKSEFVPLGPPSKVNLNTERKAKSKYNAMVYCGPRGWP